MRTQLLFAVGDPDDQISYLDGTYGTSLAGSLYQSHEASRDL